MGRNFGPSKIIGTKELRKVRWKKIVIETDCPYLTPVPFRGKSKTSPFIRYIIAEEIARIKEVSVEEVIRVTTENA